MNDIELIELAAKAAGIQGHVSEGAAEFNFWLREPDRFGRTWAPLTDDGDALRLAVKLEIGITYSRKYVTACADSHAGVGISEYGKDRYAATRRAIVRAAAAIGKVMP